MKPRSKLLALILGLVLLLSLLAGCGAKSVASDSSTSGTDSAETAPAVPEESYEMVQDDTTAENDSGGLTSDTPEGGQPVSDFTEKLIYSADVTIETTDFDGSTTAVEKMVADFGGFVESSQVSGNTRYDSDGTVRVVDRSAYYVLRVPADRFEEALTQAGGIGNVIFSNSQLDNITTQFTDQEARKNSLEIQEERLLAMLEQATDVETLVQLEARLSEVRYEIESIESTLRNWQNQVDYSTIRLNLYEVAVYTPTASVQRSYGQQLSDALEGGWAGFVRAMKSLSIALVSGLPLLILLGLVAFGVVFTVRRRRNGRRGGRKSPPDSQPPQDPPAEEPRS